jgi:hypothetical protein
VSIFRSSGPSASYSAILVVSVAIAAAGWWRGLNSEPQPVVRLSVEWGPEMSTAGFGAGSLLAISRDGLYLAVSVSLGSEVAIKVLPLVRSPLVPKLVTDLRRMPELKALGKQ